jgi:hypothetical protein
MQVGSDGGAKSQIDLWVPVLSLSNRGETGALVHGEYDCLTSHAFLEGQQAKPSNTTISHVNEESGEWLRSSSQRFERALILCCNLKWNLEWFEHQTRPCQAMYKPL